MYGRGVNKNYLKKRNRGLVLQLIEKGAIASLPTREKIEAFLAENR